MLTIVDVTDESGAMTRLDLLQRSEAVHRELRPHIPANYVAKMQRVFAEGGRMSVALDGEMVVGIAVWRAFEDTFNGRKFYCDDLVTTETMRSHGVGRALIAHMAARSKALGCDNLVLDSGTQRTNAHRFYFREGFVITSFDFKKSLK